MDDGHSNVEEDERGGHRDKSRGAVQPAVNGNAILPTRTRGAASRPAAGKAALEESLKKGQDALLDEKVEELKGRYARGEIQVNSKKQKQKNMGLIQSYSSLKRLPADLKKGNHPQLYVDE